MIKTKLAFLVLFSFMLIGASCDTIPTRTVDNISITKNFTSVEILHPPLPEPVVWEEFEWTILTPTMMKNLLEQYNDGKLLKEDVVFFALTAKGYENLSKNMAEIIRYMEGQKEVILYYKTTVPKEIFMENNK